MVVQPNKPIIFGVDHEFLAVSRAIEDFKKALIGKKTLFIELNPNKIGFMESKNFMNNKSTSPNDTSMSLDVGAYLRLVNEAKKAGLQIVALDRDDWSKRYDQTRVEWYLDDVGHLLPNQMAYENMEKRERLWIEKLKNVTSASIVVMHPGHARRIIKEMKINVSNIAYFGKYRPETMQWEQLARPLSIKEAQRIEAERLARRLRSSKARATKVSRSLKPRKR